MASACDVTGESREIKFVYPDGSYNCPFCGYAVTVGSCNNPWCIANPAMPIERALEIKHKEADRVAEDERRKRQHENAMERIREDRENVHRARMAAIDEAKRRGSCLNCLFDNYDRVKYIKHRGPCPNVSRGHR